MKEKQIDCREYARQMRENCARINHGDIICSGELWEEIANIIEGFADYRKQSVGEWVWKHNGYMKSLHCSCCGRQEEWTTDFCPNCGARMMGVKR